MSNVYPLRSPLSPIEPWGGFYPSEILQRPPPREWIVDEMIPRKTVTLLAGAPKTAKSKLLQQLLMSAAWGVPWIGQHVERVRGLGVFCEDDRAELERRSCDIAEAYEKDLTLLDMELELNPREWLSTKLVKFPRERDPVWTPFGETLWQQVEEMGYALIVLDTATACFGWPGRWTGDRAFEVVRMISIEAARLNCAVIVTDHTNRADASGFAGTNTWLGSVRAAMNLRTPTDELSQELDRERRILRDLGGNYGHWQPINLRWDRKTLVPEDPEPLERRPQTYAEKVEFYHEIARYLAKCVEHGKVVPVDETDPKSLPNRVRKWRKLPLNDLYAAQQWLLDHQLVSIVRVEKKLVMRPRDMRYEGEEPWQTK